MADDKIVSLKQEAARVVEELRRVHEAAEAENRDLTAEEAQEFDRLSQARSSLNARVKRTEDLRTADQATATFYNSLDGSALGHGNEERAAAEKNRDEVRGFEAYLRSGVMPEGATMGENGGLESRTGGDPRKREQRADFSTTGAAGGFTIPQSFSDLLFSYKVQQGAVRKTNVHVFETGDGRAMPVPVRTANLAFGWLTEGSAPAAVADTFAQVTLNAYAGGAMAKVSIPLIQDSEFDLAAEVAKVLGIQIGRGQNLAYVFGTGSTQPLGMSLVNSIAASVGGVNPGELEAAAAAGPTSDEVVSWIYTLGAQYRSQAQILMADSLEKVVSTLKSTTGEYLWRQSLVDGAPNTLMGLPVYNDPDLQATGTDEHVVGIVADFDNFYAIRDVKSVEVLRFNERFGDALQVGFFGYQRTDGHIIDAAAGVQLACGAA